MYELATVLQQSDLASEELLVRVRRKSFLLISLFTIAPSQAQAASLSRGSHYNA